jgi:dihydrofolate reductase
MATVVSDMSISLDGFVADANDNIEQVFGWYFSGDVAVPTANPAVAFPVSEESAGEVREALASVGALVSGRRTFDLAGGWDGSHPMGVPVYVVTHSVPDGWPREGSSIHFVTDGVESAIEQAKAAAGYKIVGVASPNVIQQALNAGLIDAIRVSVVPVLLGEGVRFFGNVEGAPVQLKDPRVVDAPGVTHLYYRVR